MKQNNDIEPCQGYRGWADVEAIEYKYPRIKPLKYVYMEGTEIYDEPVEDAGEYALGDLMNKGEEMTFVYDFGDYWRHTWI